MSDWIEKVQEELNNEKPGQVHYLGSMEGVKSLPQTVCLVYMTENHDGGQASYCEVYKDEATAVRSLLSRGYTTYGLSGTYRIDFAMAEVVDEVKVRTDEKS